MMFGRSAPARAIPSPEQTAAIRIRRKRGRTMVVVIGSLIRRHVHPRVAQPNGVSRLGGPVRVARGRKSKHFALPRRGALDEALQLPVLAHPRPEVITGKVVRRSPPHEVVGKPCPEVRL